uniref:Uncharacterized protein n=1 Tax=Sphaerodactylus townsendi TaxID=933632 RepID=A0ACB8EMA7_9SAUR
MSQGDEAPACLELNKQLVSFEERTAAVQGVFKQLREQQAFPCLKEWREELYSVMPYFCDAPLFSMERAATRESDACFEKFPRSVDAWVSKNSFA